MQGEEGLSWLGSLCETRSLTSEMISVLADFLIARYPDDFRIEGLAAHPAISQATREELLDAPLGDNGRQSVAEGFAQNPTTSQDDLHKLACRAAVADYGNAALALHVAANPSTAPATLDALVANFNSSPRGAGKGDFADFHFERYNGDKVDPAIGYAGMRSYDWPKLLHAVALNPATSWETLTVLAYTCSEGGARDTARAKLRFMGVPGKSGQTKPARAPYYWNVTGAMNSLAEARVDITANALKELSGASHALRLMTGALLKGLKGSFGDVPTPQRPYVCETESLSGVIGTAQRRPPASPAPTPALPHPCRPSRSQSRSQRFAACFGSLLLACYPRDNPGCKWVKPGRPGRCRRGKRSCQGGAGQGGPGQVRPGQVGSLQVGVGQVRVGQVCQVQGRP